MTNKRELFPLPAFAEDRPLTQHPLYQWLVANEDRLETRHRDILGTYLQEQGYDPEKHKLSTEDLRSLRYAQEAYDTLWMPTREPQRLEDLFTPVYRKGTGGAFWLRGATVDGTEQVTVKPPLKNLIDKAQPIYEMHPDHYYFEVVNGVLFLKYQHIIGSRRLCPVKEDTNA